MLLCVESVDLVPNTDGQLHHIPPKQLLVGASSPRFVCGFVLFFNFM